MARISFSKIGETPFARLLGHHPMLLGKWNDLEQAVYLQGSLSAELKEQVRRTLAFGNGCEYCMAKGKPDDHFPDTRLSLAVAFAQIVSRDHLEVEDRTFAILREEFSEQEIVELTAFICFITASQMFGAMMDLKPEDVDAGKFS